MTDKTEYGEQAKNVVFWWKSAHVFSLDNYSYTFVCRNKTFHNITQWLSYSKAMYFNDEFQAENILKNGKLHTVSNEIANKIFEKREEFIEKYEKSPDKKKYMWYQWGKVKADFLEEGLTSRFKENNKLRNLLIDTGDRLLLEAGNNNFWASGMDYSQIRMMVRGEAIKRDYLQMMTNKKARNLVGSILMNLRDEFIEEEKTTVE